MRHPYDQPDSMVLATGLSLIQDMMKSNIPNLLAEDKQEFSDIVKRWGGWSDEIKEFIFEGKVGDIFLKKTYLEYNTGQVAPQQFRNTAPSAAPHFANGTVHVDIGFVDFGVVIDGVETIQTEGPPVTVLAFDKEPMCVAKSMIMLEMMKISEIKPRNIIEVWMSTLWTRETLEFFTAAVRNVMGTHKRGKSLPKEVINIVVFWNEICQKAPMNKTEAIQFWLLRHLLQMSNACMNACNLLSADDRVSLLRYELTGALYEDEFTVVGSVVMCSENLSLGLQQKCEPCTEAAPSDIHLLPKRGNMKFMDRFRHYFEDKIGRFTACLKGGTLVFIPRLAMIDTRNTELLEEIRRAQPYSISWSNVCDYMSPTDFHAIARAVSNSETVHYVHSCNWTTVVYGTDVYDCGE